MAFDLADRALREYPDDLWLRHRAVLALARAGSTGEATRRFVEYGLKGVADEDVAALEARIAKDAALAQHDVLLRRRDAATSAHLYETIFRDTGGYYPAVNAATMYLIGGQPQLAETLAGEALEAVGADDASYYAHATVAEAELLRGNVDSARAALERAAAHADGDFAALATTRRQLRLVCQSSGVQSGVLDVLASPGVVHFCGHRIAAAGKPGRFVAEREDEIRAAIRTQIEQRKPGFAYGALASGADILWAEALLGAGAELHVVLPFSDQEFIKTSVEDSGAGWVDRFKRCRDAATSVTHATAESFLGDDVLYQ